VRRAVARRLDLAIALTALALVLVELVNARVEPGEWLPSLLAYTVITLALIWRRRAFFAAAVVVFAVAAPIMALEIGPEEIGTPFLVVLVLAFTAGSFPDPRRAVLGAAVLVAGVLSLYLASRSTLVSDYVFPSGFVLAVWTAARVLRTRAQLAAELHEAAVRAQEDGAAERARAGADERRRIAREMHDVVAHSVSVMVVQAGGARRILDRDPARAAAAAALVERTGRQALAEMRLLLGVLHADGAGEADAALEPQPSLDGLEGLVARARAAGLPVSLRVSGERRELPAGAEVALYRVAQEALTNAIKHAAGAPAAVLLTWGADAVELTVADLGADAGAGADALLPGGGHGLMGMRERMRVHGGEVDAGRRPGGGFAVRARLPLLGEEQAAA
jgi:signal transduction histidine kinase